MFIWKNMTALLTYVTVLLEEAGTGDETRSYY